MNETFLQSLHESTLNCVVIIIGNAKYIYAAWHRVIARGSGSGSYRYPSTGSD